MATLSATKWKVDKEEKPEVGGIGLEIGLCSWSLPGFKIGASVVGAPGTRMLVAALYDHPALSATKQ